MSLELQTPDKSLHPSYHSKSKNYFYFCFFSRQCFFSLNSKQKLNGRKDYKKNERVRDCTIDSWIKLGWVKPAYLLCSCQKTWLKSLSAFFMLQILKQILKSFSGRYPCLSSSHEFRIFRWVFSFTCSDDTTGLYLPWCSGCGQREREMPFILQVCVVSPSDFTMPCTVYCRQAWLRKSVVDIVFATHIASRAAQHQ